MTTQPTPGPWTIDQDDAETFMIYCVRAHGETIPLARVRYEGDARLIAAAPRLLEALNKIAAHIQAGLDDFSHENECDVNEHGDGCTCVLNKRVWEPLRKAEREAREARALLRELHGDPS